MKYTATEKKALKRLGLQDFRHMTKDKVVSFATMLPYMDPEVAKKALEQFPAFKDLAGDIVTYYKDIVDKGFEENRISQQTFYDACNSIIQSLQEELRMEDIDAIERDRIENKMIEVARMIGEKDTENKKMITKTHGLVAVFLLTITGVAAALLGSNIHFSNDGDQLADSSDDDDDEISYA